MIKREEEEEGRRDEEKKEDSYARAFEKRDMFRKEEFICIHKDGGWKWKQRSRAPGSRM